jgi:hypothetical protein
MSNGARHSRERMQPPPYDGAITGDVESVFKVRDDGNLLRASPALLQRRLDLPSHCELYN